MTSGCSCTWAGVPVVITRSMYFGDDDFEGALDVVDELAEFVDTEW